MEHFYRELQQETFFNYQNVYDKVIRELDDAKFVEIGVWKGQSVCYAAVEIINKGKNIQIDAVDTWEGSPEESFIMNDPSIVNGTLYDEFIRNIEPVKHIVTPIRMDSVSAASTYQNGSLDFVFIDGAHNYNAIRADIDAWLPKVKPGGYIGGHDYDFKDVKTAVDEAFHEGIEVYNTPWSSWLYRKA